MKRTPQMQHYLDRLGEAAFSMTHSEALKQNICVSCKKRATEFRDELSAKEYTISQLCQKCQDIAFAPLED